MTIIGTDAPTMTHDDNTKGGFFCAQLSQLIHESQKEEKLITLENFNATVGANNESWPEIIGAHGVDKYNSNGLLHLAMCMEQNPNITNTHCLQKRRQPGCTHDPKDGI